MSTVRRHADRPPGTSGFTLAEVLVVVSIIALLVAILLPSLRKSREQAKRTQCLTHVREIAQTWNMYLDENEGRFLKGQITQINFGGRQGTASFYGGPASAPVPVAKPLNAQWKLPLVLYDKGKVFQCPADKGGGIAAGTYFSHYGNSYQTNQLLVGQDVFSAPASFGACQSLFVDNFTNAKNRNRLKRMNLSQVSNLSKLILMGDSGWWSAWNPGLSLRVEWHRVPFSHNVAFMDTHAEFLRIDKGMHVASEYTVIPFQDLESGASRCQSP